MAKHGWRSFLWILLGFALVPTPAAAQIGPSPTVPIRPEPATKLPAVETDLTFRSRGTVPTSLPTARLFVGQADDAADGLVKDQLNNNQAGKHHRLQVSARANTKLTAATVVNSLGMRLVNINPGSFTMGTPIWCEIADLDESAHEVRLTLPYYLGVFEVTQGQYQDVMQANPSHFRNDKRHDATHEFPVDRVTWMEATEFCRRLSALPSERRAGRVYRLPTEAEWEFACRAGNAALYHFGDDPEELRLYAWFAGNAERSTQPVGRKLPNASGLYDMHGNVWEWCSDWYDQYDSRNLVTEDPQGPEQGDYRVVRGGAWRSPEENCRSADRGCESPTRRCDRVGFRVLMIIGAIPEAAASRLLTERAWEATPLAAAPQFFHRVATDISSR